jgi:hypothetical protein
MWLLLLLPLATMCYPTLHPECTTQHLLLLQEHPAWDNFDLAAMRAEFEAAEREKAAYLAAKAAAGGK